MISATDPVSVLALFKTLALPPRLATIVEGESLLNDGTAVVVFRIILIGAAGSSAGEVALSSLGEFLMHGCRRPPGRRHIGCAGIDSHLLF